MEGEPNQSSSPALLKCIKKINSEVLVLAINTPEEKCTRAFSEHLIRNDIMKAITICLLSANPALQYTAVFSVNKFVKWQQMAIVNANVVPLLVPLLQSDDDNLCLQSVLVLSEIVDGGVLEHIIVVVKANAVPHLIKLCTQQNRDVLCTSIIKALSVIFAAEVPTGREEIIGHGAIQQLKAIVGTASIDNQRAISKFISIICEYKQLLDAADVGLIGKIICILFNGNDTSILTNSLSALDKLGMREDTNICSIIIASGVMKSLENLAKRHNLSPMDHPAALALSEAAKEQAAANAQK
uniref:Uncharacterized protein n=1 Tax=Globodera rostochiensis TaxID=31243 RepID=A0A914IAB3_GLORO